MFYYAICYLSSSVLLMALNVFKLLLHDLNDDDIRKVLNKTDTVT